MKQKSFLWTSECVSPGHPDKLADQISDAMLDAYLEQDSYSKVACETLISPGKVIVAGEVTSDASFDEDEVILRAIYEAGYDSSKYEVIKNINTQSLEISSAVTGGGKSSVIGAGDQGMMFGYATNETPTFMPSAIFLSRSIIDSLVLSRTDESLDFLRPDSKSQVTMRYVGDKPIEIDTILISTQHSGSIGLDELRGSILLNIVKKTIDSCPNDISSLYTKNTKVIINPAGIWTIGGPDADVGLTGRKIVVDNYGADCPIGGGAFSGKDPTKVDRSAAYASRYIAKSLVCGGVARKARVQVSYAIGIENPVSVTVDTFGTSTTGLTDNEISEAIAAICPLSVGDIIDKFQLRNPIYRVTARDGHFGINPYRLNGISYYTWEETSDSDDIQSLI
jgi:S-adenosylmethionine synthetase|tara:strand:- start:1026 stop:2207 length:1182 start_codon:yes stop_codon:yes gene_type:complete